MSVLLLRLAGPMQSWGTQSRFSVRDTGLEPSKSGVIGLLCAALGRPRTEPVDDLSALTLGVRADREGSMKKDYHTALEVAKAGGGKPKDCEPSTRYYLADADFLVGLEGDRHLLEELHAALAAPVWALYLGRKSFVPALPVWLPEGLSDNPLAESLGKFPWMARNRPEAQKKPDRLRVVMDATFGTTPEVRCDVPDRPFSERHFTIRHVQTKWIELSAEMVLLEEETACLSTSRA